MFSALFPHHRHGLELVCGGAVEGNSCPLKTQFEIICEGGEQHHTVH